MSKNILGTGVGGGAILVSGELNINTLSATKIQGSRITDNSIDFYAPQVELTTQDDFNININNNNNGTSSKLQVKNNNDVRMTLDDTGLDLKSGLTYKIGNSQISSANLSNDANLAKINTANTFTGQATFNNGIITDSVAGKTNSDNALIFTNGVDASLETPDDITLKYNAGGGQGTSGVLKVRDNITTKAEFNNNGLKLSSGLEIFYDTTELKNVAETLTNKSLTTPTIASIQPSGGNLLTLPTTTDTLVGKATTDTLTNKTLTAPIISTIQPQAGSTLTLPVATDTLVGKATTDTLTNKEIVSCVLTTPTIASLRPSASNLITFPDSTDDVVLRTETQTLTNKSLLQPSLTQPSMSQLKPNGSTTISFPTTGGADNCVYEDHTQTLTNKTITASNNSLSIASTDLTDAGSFISAGGSNNFTGATNTFSNNIVGNITGNPFNGTTDNDKFVGFFGKLANDVSQPANTNDKFNIGPWNVVNNLASTGQRNAWNEGISLINNNTQVGANFTLTKGIYLINATIRVSDYEPSGGNLLLFFSTNSGILFSGGVDASYPQSWGNRRVLQDTSNSMTLNISVYLDQTTICCLGAQNIINDTSSGFSINRRSWLSVVKIRNV
jgi:hypothetical protein